jgi:hypothetical protein
MTSRKSYQCLGGCNVLIGEWSTPDREWRDLTRFIKKGKRDVKHKICYHTFSERYIGRDDSG